MITTYEVRCTLVVDRPELRDSSFAVVAPGTKSTYVLAHATQGAAVRCFSRIVAGKDDYASEFVSRACVVAVTRTVVGYDNFGAVSQAKSLRTVRSPVERTRTESRRDQMRQVLRCAAARKPTALWMTFREPFLAA